MENSTLSLVEEAYGIKIIPELYGGGHINKTYVTESRPRLIVQEVNTSVFKDPVAMMKNVISVTERLGQKLKAEGKDPERYTLTVVPAKDGERYKIFDGRFYCAYLFIEGSRCFDTVTPEVLRLAGLAFGRFGRQLADFPAETLSEVIPHFHDTPSRYEDLLTAIERDTAGRAAEDGEEIDFFKEYAIFYGTVTERLADGRLSLAVTHNDTKINNILFDAADGQPLAVIDLDTVMPGSRLYDFGDALRTGAATAAEDETDLSLVSFDKEKFAAFTKGYLEAAGVALTEEELDLLPESALLMTLECGMRFLTDDLNGDVYFRTHRPRHNLDRARNQIKMAQEIEKMLPELHEIVKDCVQKNG